MATLKRTIHPSGAAPYEETMETYLDGSFDDYLDTIFERIDFQNPDYAIEQDADAPGNILLARDACKQDEAGNHYFTDQGIRELRYFYDQYEIVKE